MSPLRHGGGTVRKQNPEKPCPLKGGCVLRVGATMPKLKRSKTTHQESRKLEGGA